MLATVTRKPDHRGEHGISRKTIVRGMPDDFGEPVVTYSYAFLFCMRGCGRIERPAFPAPSDVSDGLARSETRAEMRGEMAAVWVFAWRNPREMCGRRVERSRPRGSRPGGVAALLTMRIWERRERALWR